MGMSGARAWEAVGASLAGIGQRLSQKKDEAAVLARQKVEDDRRHTAEDAAVENQRLEQDLRLAALGGGRGSPGTDMRTIVGTGMQPSFQPPQLFSSPPMTRSPLAPPAEGNPGGAFGTDDYYGAGNEPPPPMFRGRGIGLDATTPAAPRMDGGSLTAPIQVDSNASRFQKVGDNAFIKRPEVMERERANEMDARALEADRAKVGLQAEQLQVQLPAVAARLRAQDPTMTESRALAQADLMLNGLATYGQLNPREPAPRAESRDPGLPTFDQAYRILSQRYQRIENDASGRPYVAGYTKPDAEIYAEAQAMVRGEAPAQPSQGPPATSPQPTTTGGRSFGEWSGAAGIDDAAARRIAPRLRGRTDEEALRILEQVGATPQEREAIMRAR